VPAPSRFPRSGQGWGGPRPRAGPGFCVQKGLHDLDRTQATAALRQRLFLRDRHPDPVPSVLGLPVLLPDDPGRQRGAAGRTVVLVVGLPVPVLLRDPGELAVGVLHLVWQAAELSLLYYWGSSQSRRATTALRRISTHYSASVASTPRSLTSSSCRTPRTTNCGPPASAEAEYERNADPALPPWSAAAGGGSPEMGVTPCIPPGPQLGRHVGTVRRTALVRSPGLTDLSSGGTGPGALRAAPICWMYGGGAGWRPRRSSLSADGLRSAPGEPVGGAGRVEEAVDLSHVERRGQRVSGR
jgi:hypothetical protein